MNLDHHDVAVFTLLVLVAAVLSAVDFVAGFDEDTESVLDFFVIVAIGWTAYGMGNDKP